MLGICPLQIPSIRSFETLCCYWLSLDISSRDFSLPNWCPTPAFLLMLLPNCHPLAQKEQPPPLYTNRGVGFAICFFFFFWHNSQTVPQGYLPYHSLKSVLTQGMKDNPYLLPTSLVSTGTSCAHGAVVYKGTKNKRSEARGKRLPCPLKLTS